MASELVDLQAGDTPTPEALQAATDLIIPPERAANRLRHFPEEVYDLSAESHLVRFLKVMLGDAGAGQLRKRLNMVRLQSALHTSHFYDLDRFYGALFGIKRAPGEKLDINPYTDTATTEFWLDQHVKDASFKSRIVQFAKAFPYGGTPTGIELVAEALLSVDCDVYEMFYQADEGYQTYAELEDLYGPGTPGGTYADMEGKTYAELEGAGIPRLAGNERRIFVIRPKRVITPAEAHSLSRVLDRIKPADARYIIDFEGVTIHDPVPLVSLTADSVYWEVIPQVAARTLAVSPYEDPQALSVEQPRPPFSGYQGEAWSYNGDVVGVSAYSRANPFGEYDVMPAQRVMREDGSFTDYAPGDAVLPRRFVQGGRSVSDAILVSHPYSGPRGQDSAEQEGLEIIRGNVTAIAKLYADRIPLDALNDTIARLTEIEPFQQNPDGRFWATPERSMADFTEEVIEVRLSGDRLVNYLTYEVPHFPHDSVAQAWNPDTGIWDTLHVYTVTDSFPSFLSGQATNGHPQHDAPGHWIKVGTKVEPRVINRFRVVLSRRMGEPPRRSGRSPQPGTATPTTELPYSLGARSIDLGYRISSRSDIPEVGTAIGTSTDLLGSPVQFVAREDDAANLLDDSGVWRSEPQPVSYAVVNLYVDARDDQGDSQVIDRFFVNPTHPGAHCTIYYSNDAAFPDGTPEFFEQRTWRPINRDYILQKGFWHLPPTRARFFKFEFTNLVAEPYESFVPINRKVRLFPNAIVQQMYGRRTESSGALPRSMASAIEVASENLYRDAVYILTGSVLAPTYSDTSALTVFDPQVQQSLHNQSWVFGFQPWHQGDEAPRFLKQGTHHYEVAEVQHAHKVAFFVGLSEFRAHRVDFEEDDDTFVYLDTFDDFRNLVPGFTWQFDPNTMTATTDTATATSRVFSSRHNIKAIQFATQQSNPLQLVPDDDFRDPGLVDSDWSDTDTWHRVGDASLFYSQGDHSVRMVRFVTPPPKVVTADLTPEHGTIKPVFSYRDTTVADEAAAEDDFGGIASPIVNPSAEGRIYAAVRLTLDTDLTSPLLLQITNPAQTVVYAEMEITGQRGEMIERYVHLDLTPGITEVRARLMQEGKSNDAWRLDTLSIFDEGIVWEFSVNGGTDFIMAKGIRNNQHGILTFPASGNQLVYRVRGLRPKMTVSAIQIRPIYQGNENSRIEGTHRGPNVSTYDHEPPIYDDPMFTTWTKPIPRGWFYAARRFPILPIEGQPYTNEFSRFYARTANDTIAAPTDSAARWTYQPRQPEDRLDFWNPLSDLATRTGVFNRTPGDIAPATDTTRGDKIERSTNPIVNEPTHEVM